jgi:Ca2+-binding RTX toxin-like protein
LFGSNNAPLTAENFVGGVGNDTIDGRGGFDRAVYSLDDAVAAGISVNLAAGIVTGDARIGTDTLRSVEAVRGTDFADTFDATGFTATSTNAGSAGVNASGAAFNDFEGMGGNDTITGNGNTRVSYDNATAGVTVTLGVNGSGTATGDASVGTDTFVSGVFRVRGSDFADTISGNGGINTLEGQGGNDTLTGGAGADHFVYAAVNTGLDHIVDFSGHGGQNDVLDFDNQAFGNGLAIGGADTGTLDPSHFIANGTGATTAQQVFWYNTNNSTLYYDADGSGSGAAVAVAEFENGFVLNSTDIHLIKGVGAPDRNFQRTLRPGRPPGLNSYWIGSCSIRRPTFVSTITTEPETSVIPMRENSACASGYSTGRARASSISGSKARRASRSISSRRRCSRAPRPSCDRLAYRSTRTLCARVYSVGPAKRATR